MDRVLGTVETLELVLLEVDIRTLLVSASRTCHLWHSTIQSSPQLQTLLFFRPEAAAPTTVQDCNDARANPLLLRAFGTLLSNTSETHEPSNKDSLLYPEASWRRMLVWRPSVHRIGIWKVETGFYLQHGFENETEILDFAQEGGVRMDNLVEYAAGLKPGYSWTLFWGETGRQLLEKERNSLFYLKASLSKRKEILEMWRDSDIVVKLVRWSKAR